MWGDETRQELRAFGRREGNLGARDGGLDAHDHVERVERGARSPRALAQAAAQPVAIDRARDGLAPDDITDAADGLRGGRGDKLEKAAVKPATGGENRLERARTAQPVAARR